MFFCCLFLDPHLTSPRSSIGVHSRYATKIGPLTLELLGLYDLSWHEVKVSVGHCMQVLTRDVGMKTTLLKLVTKSDVLYEV